MALYPVGVSSYGVLRGRMQYVTDAVVAAQVRALIEDSRGVFAGGAVLSVNEGVRSRPDQAQKLDAYRRYRAGGPWAPLAASPLYTSTHDESRGSALDFGVTMPDGRNRAMTMSEQSWVVTRGALRGIRWTGRDFRPTPESWHFNGGYPATLPASSGAVPFPEEDDMTPEQNKMLTYVYEVLSSPGKDNEGVPLVKQVRAAAVDAFETRKLVGRLVNDTKDEASIPRLSRALGTRLTNAQSALDALLKLAASIGGKR